MNVVKIPRKSDTTGLYGPLISTLQFNNPHFIWTNENRIKNCLTLPKCGSQWLYVSRTPEKIAFKINHETNGGYVCGKPYDISHIHWQNAYFIHKQELYSVDNILSHAINKRKRGDVKQKKSPIRLRRWSWANPYWKRRPFLEIRILL